MDELRAVEAGTISADLARLRLHGELWSGGYSLEPGLPFDVWQSLAPPLVNLHRAAERLKTASLFAIGDWLVYGDAAVDQRRLPLAERRKYGERYYQVASLYGYDSGYLMNLASVARHFPPARRAVVDADGARQLRWPRLSFGHLQAATSLPKRQGDALLDRAEQEGWLRHQVREAASRLRALAEAKELDRLAAEALAAELPATANLILVPTPNGRAAPDGPELAAGLRELSVALRLAAVAAAPLAWRAVLVNVPNVCWEAAAACAASQRRTTALEGIVEGG